MKSYINVVSGVISVSPEETNWLYCDGSEYDPEKYPKLSTILRGKFGHNRLPDLRDPIVVQK